MGLPKGYFIIIPQYVLYLNTPILFISDFFPLSFQLPLYRAATLKSVKIMLSLFLMVADEIDGGH